MGSDWEDLWQELGIHAIAASPSCSTGDVVHFHLAAVVAVPQLRVIILRREEFMDMLTEHMGFVCLCIKKKISIYYGKPCSHSDTVFLSNSQPLFCKSKE